MIRYELIKRISRKFDVEETEAGIFVERIFESMVKAFENGKRINIPEFGKFNLTYKTVDGVRQRYVVFSPSKNFAETINRNFSDLEPLVVNAYSVKQKDELKVKEILPDENDEDYLYFQFYTDEEESVREEIPASNLPKEEVVSDTSLTKDETNLEEEEILLSDFPKEEVPDARRPKDETIFHEEEIIISDVPKEEKFSEASLTKEEASLQEEEIILSDVPEEDVYDIILINDDEFLKEEETIVNDIQEEEQELIKVFSENTDINVYTETNDADIEQAERDTFQKQNIFEDVSDVKEITLQQNVFDEDADENAVKHQTVFEDEKQTLLSEYSVFPEEQILENAKVIEEVEKIDPSSVRINLKDDLNFDNIKDEIFDILVKREEILRELNALNTGIEIKPDVPKQDDKINYFPEIPIAVKEPESKEPPKVEETPMPPDESSEIYTELEKRIRELDELSQIKAELEKVVPESPQSQEMQIFGKLIDDGRTEDRAGDEGISFPEIIIHDPVPEPEVEVKAEVKAEYVEPKSLADALEDIKLDGIIEHMEAIKDEDRVKSYDDIFRKSETQFKPQFTVEPEKEHTQGRFFKMFLYVFFVFLLIAFSFYIYKTLFVKSTSNQIADTSGIEKIDSVRAFLKKVDDSIAKNDNSSLATEDNTEQTESLEIKDLYGVIYRELGGKIYIQNKVFTDLNEAEEMEIKLKTNNLKCRIEGATKVDSGLEYRVLVGPFNRIEEAMEYYEKNKVVLNFIQIMDPNKPNLLVF
jgi:nucleoid DNA-binding protein